MTPNAYELRAREEKCRKLAKHAVGTLIALLEGFNVDSWASMASEAGLNAPSEQSQKRVIEMLKEIR